MWEMERGGAAALGWGWLTALIMARLEMCFTSGGFIPAFLLPAIATGASDSLELESKAGNEAGRERLELPHPGTGKGPSPKAVFGHCSQAQDGIAGVSWSQDWTDDPSGPFPLGILCDSEFTSFPGGSAHLKAVSCYLPTATSRAGQQEGKEFRSQAAQDLPWSCWPALITL